MFFTRCSFSARALYLIYVNLFSDLLIDNLFTRLFIHPSVHSTINSFIRSFVRTVFAGSFTYSDPRNTRPSKGWSGVPFSLVYDSVCRLFC